MARRTDEEPFRPLNAALVDSVLAGGTKPVQAETVIELPTRSRTVETPEPAESRPPPPRRHALLQRQTPPRATDSAANMPFPERLEREKRVLLTPSEERAVGRVVSYLGAELGTSLTFSNVLRSCIRLLINAEAELVDRAKAQGRVIRPPNGDHAAIEEFERTVASVLHAGLRDARSLK